MPFDVLWNGLQKAKAARPSTNAPAPKGCMSSATASPASIPVAGTNSRFWRAAFAIARRLEIREREVRDAVERVLLPLADLTNKEVGVRLATLEPLARRYAFASRKGEEAVRKLLFEDIRPDGNVLPGYTPTRGISAIDDE